MAAISHVAPYSLGIDIGTSSIKIAIVDSAGSLVENVMAASLAAVDSDMGDVGSEQCPTTIYNSIKACLRQLSPHNQAKVHCVGISGQMHGLVLWQQGKAWNRDAGDLARHITFDNVSHLYTWQDRRCTQEFLNTLPKPNSNLRTASGYGCSTLFWLQRNQPEFLAEKQFDCAGTIMDFVVAAVCDLDRPVTSDQLAASMGYFDVESGTWNEDVLQSSGFPFSMLPEVRPAGQVAGHLLQGFEHVPAGTPVLVGMGDVQAGVFSAVQSSSDALLNISTSIQISVLVDDPKTGASLTASSVAVEILPYFGDKRLAAVAGLNGGNVMNCFITMIKHWLRELVVSGVGDEQFLDKVLLDRLVILGRTSPQASTIKILPTIFGERHDPSLLARAVGISCDNATLGGLFRAISEGVVDNIFQLMPVEVLVDHGVTKVFGSGSVLCQNPMVLQRLEGALGDKIAFERGNESDSALGAAKAAMVHVQACNLSS